MAAAREEIAMFLEPLGFGKYTSRFHSQGYEYLDDVITLNESDLRALSIDKLDERESLLKAAQDISIEVWLKSNRLTDYTEAFVEEGINTIKDLKKREIDEDLMENLNIMVPGHRKRFLASVDVLKRQLDLSHEIDTTPHRQPEQSLVVQTVALGYWERSLPPSNTEFLCVQGFLRATEDSTPSESLQFTVDSASEVVTARMHIIESLGLEYLHTVESQGVHQKKEKPIYKGFIRVGKSRWIPVEVMPEAFESLGVDVIRNFYHVINGGIHRWTVTEPQDAETES